MPEHAPLWVDSQHVYSPQTELTVRLATSVWDPDSGLVALTVTTLLVHRVCLQHARVGQASTFCLSKVHSPLDTDALMCAPVSDELTSMFDAYVC